MRLPVSNLQPVRNRAVADTPKPLIVIPVYNHSAQLRAVVASALPHGEVLVVDDGSDDAPDAAVAGLPVTMLRHDENSGKGAAILTAAGYAHEHGYTHVITMDADGQHLAEDLPAFMAAIAEHPRAIIAGVRNFAQASRRNIPRSATWGRAFSNFWFRVQTGEQAQDTQNGFRAYPVPVLLKLPMTERRYAFEIEVLVRAVWANVAIRWLPIGVYYPAPEERVSHLHRVRDNVRLSLLNTRLTMRAALPVPHRRLGPVGDMEDAEKAFALGSPMESLREQLRKGLSPRTIGLSAALGVLLGTWPLFGVHTVTTLFAASFLRLSKIIAVAAGQLCMPPLVPAMCVEVGYYVRNGAWLTDVSWQTLGVEFLDRAFEWIIGSLILSPVLAALVGLLFYGLAKTVTLFVDAE